MVRAKIPLDVDEELGKKDDDHRVSEKTRFRSIQNAKVPRPRRIIIALIALVFLYEFFKNMPTDLAPAIERYNPELARLRNEGLGYSSPTKPKPEIPLQAQEQPPGFNSVGSSSYDGKIKFNELAHSLPHKKHADNTPSQAVLFAGSNLRSVSDLLPLACRMGREKLNRVHFVVMGKEEVSIEGIKQVNGITDEECPIVWHDGRPDFAAQSTNSRIERSVASALGFLHTYIAPEVIITQQPSWEDNFFWSGLAAHKRYTGTQHIALPTASRDLMWIASIDSTALQSWNDIQVDIVVHDTESSGSLIRLIRSLDAADYLGSQVRLTIELPPSVDSQILGFLQHLDGLRQLSGRIAIRRRIQPHYMDPVESSFRIVEAFYPINPNSSHLLILSPQAELAPSFYHYLKYNILTYKQSANAQLHHQISSNLLGIALELPSLSPSAKNEPFSPPELRSTFNSGKTEQENFPLFLWQAPNSNAALYFGDKWVEFHSFLSNRLEVLESKASVLSQEKLISKRYPAFMEYLLEMMRSRGYYMLYPSFPGLRASSLVTVHHELYQPPEEFSLDPNSVDSAQTIESIEDTGQSLELQTDEIEILSSDKPLDRVSTITPLLDTFALGLPDVNSLSLLSFDGGLLTVEALTRQTKEYTKYFQVHYGGCSEEALTSSKYSSPLFCL
ncbi:hypothetical protein N7495_005245 [Penicillium taxi]|uniref:uncharacterized protein n=1 Tax=Penicillium taxi TaxID=168475 RepID=UPI002544F6F6|nr:uncharacterized protein N7495_005245 [Penicillium taxi]KAJ5893554.1 hypothetical protein N7495_005245 [Penicillium taxi]